MPVRPGKPKRSGKDVNAWEAWQALQAVQAWQALQAWQAELRLGSEFRRMLRILSKWCKRSENTPNVRTSELNHISGSFLACGQVDPDKISWEI